MQPYLQDPRNEPMAPFNYRGISGHQISCLCAKLETGYLVRLNSEFNVRKYVSYLVKHSQPAGYWMYYVYILLL